MSKSPDILIIGSGIGGASIAAGLAGSGADILILERGESLRDEPENRDQRAIFQHGYFRPDEHWQDGDGRPFSPGNYSCVGGNSKFYGAVLSRFRREDFEARELGEGLSPAWPFPYEELEPWYERAEKLYEVRGSLGEDPTEPTHSGPYPHPPVPDEPSLADIRARLKKRGLHPFSLPLGIDIETWRKHSDLPWDAHPHSDCGKMDAETAALSSALSHPNVRLQTGARVTRLEAGPDGRIRKVHYQMGGGSHAVSPRRVILSAGAVQSAALLLHSADERYPAGLANASGQVGRNFMNHNASAILAVAPWFRNTARYQKTFGFNDFYHSGGRNGVPLGNVQLLGRMSGATLKGAMPFLPEGLLERITRHSVDFYAMSEDIPHPESRVMVDGERIILHWRRTNWAAHRELVATLRRILRSIGFPLVLARAFDKRTPSHQCGTVRMGRDPASAPLDPWCRAFGHPNLFVVDAGFFPSSAAVNPALTIAAQALRVADHIASKDCHA